MPSGSTWLDLRSGNAGDIYAQRVNGSGAVLWPTDGVPICTAADTQRDYRLISDGASGAIIIWGDYRSAIDIYAQRVNSSGAVLWTTDGVLIYTAASRQVFPQLVSDGAGGAIITWNTDQFSNTSHDIYAQRVNSSGVVLWPTDGVPICTASFDQLYPQLVSDEAGGAIITWQDGRNADIYAQRVDGSGVVLWPTDGVPICTAQSFQDNPQLVSDEAGGAIVTWQDGRNDPDDIYAQNVQEDGRLGGISGCEFGVLISESDGSTDVTEGGATDTYTVVLLCQPTADVTITISPDNQVSVSPGTLQFTSQNWSVPQTVTVQAVDDAVVEGSHTGTITHSAQSQDPRYNNIPIASVTVHITDNDLIEPPDFCITVDPPVLYVPRGGKGTSTYTVNSLNGFNGQVTLSCLNQPSGVNCSFSSDPVTPPPNGSVSGTLTISVSASTPVGSYILIRVRGKSEDGIIRDVPFTLHVLTVSGLKATSLQVDLRPTQVTRSNLNGILEPNECVTVEPSWESLGGNARGVALNFTGPPGPIYKILDGTANYGTPEDRYVLCVILLPGTKRPKLHWDTTFDETLYADGRPIGRKTWTLHIGESFIDGQACEPVYPFYPYIETLLHYELTVGSEGRQYHPNDPVTRDEGAIVVALAHTGENRNPPQKNLPSSGKVPGVGTYACGDGGESLFEDIAPTDFSCPHVHYLFMHRITAGCKETPEGLFYCPKDLMIRAQMAIFIAQAMVGVCNKVPEVYTDPITGRSYNSIDGEPNHFVDVPDSVFYCRHAHYLWATGVIEGCTETEFCPDAATTRCQMAAFVANGFRLKLYGPEGPREKSDPAAQLAPEALNLDDPPLNEDFQFALGQNMPNPFNPETWMPYQLGKAAHVTIEIYNMAGRLVRMLDLGDQPAGTYLTRSRAAYWDGRNDRGERVASGIYFYTLKAGEYTATRRMVILK
ncbi:T9SS type A sorting domain-containing protein [Candidatus Poribacteria bacterium]|nr:T9SS type A sorting domain-containing protein [Candidatus Poribacteria bacterium]